MENQWPGPVLKLRTAHETVGWLGSGPHGVIVITECDNPNCGCHQGAKDAKASGTHFLHLPVGSR